MVTTPTRRWLAVTAARPIRFRRPSWARTTTCGSSSWRMRPSTTWASWPTTRPSMSDAAESSRPLRASCRRRAIRKPIRTALLAAGSSARLRARSSASSGSRSPWKRIRIACSTTSKSTTTRRCPRRADWSAGRSRDFFNFNYWPLPFVD